MATGKRLEHYQSFPIIAWATVIAFALFVTTITMKLNAATIELEASTKNLEAAVKADLMSEDINALRGS